METFKFLLYFDYGATFVWAVTGGLAAARRGYDVAGIIALALVSATGGGLLRDGLFLQDGPPRILRTSAYLLIVGVAVLLVLLLGRYFHRHRLLTRAAMLADALGLGAYAVVGIQLALAAKISLPGCVLVGVVNAVGGGILRDVLSREEPEIFKPGQLMALAALAGCLTYLLLTQLLHLHATTAAMASIALTFAIRAVSVRYRLTTHTLPGVYDPPQKDRDSASSLSE